VEKQLGGCWWLVAAGVLVAGGCWLLAAAASCCWLLAAGSAGWLLGWLLASTSTGKAAGGCWLLAAGRWLLLAAGCWLLLLLLLAAAAGCCCWLLAAGTGTAVCGMWYVAPAASCQLPAASWQLVPHTTDRRPQARGAHSAQRTFRGAGRTGLPHLPGICHSLVLQN
jgi:hypothetical protein